MKGIAFFISTIVMALALIVALPNTGRTDENEQLEKYYAVIHKAQVAKYSEMGSISHLISS